MVPILPTRRPPGRRAPLPDPSAIRRVRVPDCLPPCDQEPASQPAPGCPTGGTAPDAQYQVGTSAHPPQPSRQQAASRPDDPGDDQHGSGSPGAPPRLTCRAVPGAGGWPSQFAQVLAETLAGARPAQQLAPWTTDQTRQRIRDLGPLLATGQRPRVHRIMASAPAANVLEMTAVVGFGGRVRVLAVRLERAADTVPGCTGPGWQCTALESA